MPLISVVMPVHNGERWLRESIDSILGQSFEDLEFIVVDDGSTDSTWSILEERAAKDTRLKLLRHETNQGLLAALNRGLEAAQGEFIVRHDDDDVADSNRIETQLKVMQSRPELLVLGSAFRLTDSSGSDMSLQKLPESDTEIRWRLLFDNPFCHSTVMFRRSLPDGSPVRYESKYCEDYDLWARLLQRGKGANLSEPLVTRRQHDVSYTITHAAHQQARKAEIALREITAVNPSAAWTTEQVDRIHTWYHSFPEVLGPSEIDLCRGIVALLGSFRSCRMVDRRGARRIVREWEARMLRGVPDHRYLLAWRRELLPALLRLKAGPVIKDLTMRLFRRGGGTHFESRLRGTEAT